MPQWRTQDDHYVQFDHLWDPGHLLKHASSDGVSILFPSAPEIKLKCTYNAARIDLEARLAQFKSGIERILCVDSAELYHTFWNFELTEVETAHQGFLLMHKVVAESKQFASARMWLRPSRPFAKRAYQILTDLLPADKEFYAVHVRIEEDFVNACKAWSERIDGLRCMLGVQEIADELEKHGVQQRSVLYIFPWQSFDVVSLLCRERYKCIYRDEVDTARDLAFNEKALLDFAIARHSAGAFGNIYSTMSVELIASLRAEGKPASFLNTACPKDSSVGNCP